MSKVVFLSNVDRRFAMMKVALQQLQQENLLSNDSVCVKLSDNTVWNDEWQKLLEDADILLLVSCPRSSTERISSTALFSGAAPSAFRRVESRPIL